METRVVARGGAGGLDAVTKNGGAVRPVLSRGTAMARRGVGSRNCDGGAFGGLLFRTTVGWETPTGAMVLWQVRKERSTGDGRSHEERAAVEGDAAEDVKDETPGVDGRVTITIESRSFSRAVAVAAEPGPEVMAETEESGVSGLEAALRLRQELKVR